MTDRQRKGMELLLAMMVRGERHIEPPLIEEVA
jgi:hypothetical protein